MVNERVVALAGGVGGAKLAAGLAEVVAPERLTIVVNTGDDFTHWGLHISPDVDTVMYTLAGEANEATGWGVRGDSFRCMEWMRRHGAPTWFAIGDLDLATDLVRTERLRAGATLTAVTADLCRALGVASRVLPMCDQPVATRVRTPGGEIAFQEYFVRRHQQDDVLSLRFEGADQARPSAQVEEALAEADVLVVCPSNPLLSIGPMLAVRGFRQALLDSPARKVGVSPLIGGEAVKGPLAKIMRTLGMEVSALGVARLYEDFLRDFIIDTSDAAQAPAIERLGLRTHLLSIMMQDAPDRARLAAEVLEIACRPA